MGIPSIRCGLPFCGGTEKEQTSCSLYARIAAVAFGGIILLVGILDLSGIPGLYALGTVGGGVLIGVGCLTLLLSSCLKCVSKKSQDLSPQNQVPQKPVVFDKNGTNPLDTKVNNEKIDSQKEKPHEEISGHEHKVSREHNSNHDSAENLDIEEDKRKVESKKEPIIEKRTIEKMFNTSYDLKSHKGLEAAYSQYYIDNNAPVRWTLRGPRSYCDLKAIQDPKLKEILSAVGIEYECTQRNAFFNFSHIFTPTEKNENLKSNDNHVVNIVEVLNTAVNAQTNGKLVLDLADITKISVNKGEDRSIFRPARCAYELSIEVSEKAVESAEKSGLVFREYVSSFPEGTTAHSMGVGQTTFTNQIT